MKRELASMNVSQIIDWENARREEITKAFKAGEINIRQYNQLQTWVSEECNEWTEAWKMGLLEVK